MATSPEFVRVASSAARSLTESALDAAREAIIVVDARAKHLPVVLGNAAARSCFLGAVHAASLVGSSLYSLLGIATDSAMQAAYGPHTGGRSHSTRALRWRLLRGDAVLPTELRVLPSTGQRMVMLTFADASADPTLVSSIEHLPLDLLILDKGLSVTYANAGAVRAAGGLPGGILNCSGLTLIPTAVIPRDALTRALEGSHYHDDSVAVAVPGAPTRWFEVDVQPLKDGSGIAGLAILSMEVTERRQRQRIPNEGERRLLALTEHARDIITVAGRDGRLQYISGGIRNSLGYTVEERRSNSLFEHVHPDDVEAIQAQFAQLVSGAINTFSHQFRVRHKDGSYRWLESNYVSALDNPLIKGVVVNSRDITERRHAEHLLAQREEVFRLATEAVNGIIFEWDLARGTVHRSRGVQEVLGLEPEEVAREGAWSARIHPQDDAAYSKAISIALRLGRGWTTTYRIRDSRGRYRSMLERGLIQRSEDGKPLRAIGCCVDVSEIKRLTDLLAEAQHAAKMGGWEYSYPTGELTWTDEMFRIYEASTERLSSVSWDSDADACARRSRGSASATRSWLAEAMPPATSTSSSRSPRCKQPAPVGEASSVTSRRWRGMTVPRLRLGAKHPVAEARADRAWRTVPTGWLKLSMNMAHIHAWRWDRASDTLEFAMHRPAR